jgi:hypothetical protein
LASASAMKEKSFITLTTGEEKKYWVSPVVNVIKLFSFVADDEAK